MRAGDAMPTFGPSHASGDGGAFAPWPADRAAARNRRRHGEQQPLAAYDLGRSADDIAQGL
jgi:hypothetical protein